MVLVCDKLTTSSLHLGAEKGFCQNGNFLVKGLAEEGMNEEVVLGSRVPSSNVKSWGEIIVGLLCHGMIRDYLFYY
jgi:hypothetical protein